MDSESEDDDLTMLALLWFRLSIELRIVQMVSLSRNYVYTGLEYNSIWPLHRVLDYYLHICCPTMIVSFEV